VKCIIEKIRPISPGVGATEKMDIVPGKAVLSGHGLARTFLEKKGVGDEIYVNWGVTLENNPQMKAFTNIVAGGTICLKNAVRQPYVATDTSREKDRHPRTSVGYNNERTKVYFVVVDGRQTGVTVGVSTRELADIMAYAGADNALNLDGGGSSAMAINKEIKNTPSERRNVVNGLLLAKVPAVIQGINYGDTPNDQVQVYPNPAGKLVFFRVNLEKNIRSLQINLCDVNGKKIQEVCREKNVRQGTESIYSFETTNLKTGVYFYEVIQDGKRTGGKLIIK
jgi:hypothetical protein